MSGTMTLQRGSLVRRSFLSDLRVLLAVAAKEWAIFRRYPSWVAMFIVWPILFPMAYIFTAKAMSGPDGAGLEVFRSVTGTADYVSYMVLGSAIWMWLNITLWDVGLHLRTEQMRGTLESNWMCPVWRVAIMLGSSLTKIGTSLFFLVVMVIECRLVLGIYILRGNVALILLILLLVMPTIYGIGLAFASLVIRFKEANTMVFLVRGIFMIFCGMTYPVAVLPAWMQHVSSLLPLTYAIQGIRRVALTGATASDIRPELLKLAAFGLAMPIAGYLIFHYVERRSRRTGALGQY
jgi:ABC-2 type transport system permease protein